MHGLAVALSCAAALAYYVNPTEVDRLATDLIELSTRHNFMHWLGAEAVYRGWARSASGDTAEGISWIEQGNKRLSGNRRDTESATFVNAKRRSLVPCEPYIRSS